jgi:phytoene dehydrogenase-like protein
VSTPGDDYDVAVVGAGPNGLTAAAYLARAGARVVLLERRFERGGRLATDDYSTPFQYNLALFELPLADELPPYRDLELHAQGVRFVRPEIAFAVATGPGEAAFAVGRGGRGLGREVEQMLAAASAAVAPLLYRPPAPEEELRAGLAGGEQEPCLALADLTPPALAERAADPRAAIALRYACGLAGFLDGGEALGLFGAFRVARLFSPAIVVGGSKNLANGSWRAAAAAGARGRLSSEVTGIEGSSGAFTIRTSDGRETRARAVVSTVGSRPPVPRAGPFTAHFGIKGDPPAPVAVDGEDALIRIFGFESGDDVKRHFTTALRGELPEKVAGHLTAVSVHDPMQASPGPFGPLHTLRMQTFVPHDLPAPGWDRARTSHRVRCWDALVESFTDLTEATLLFQFCDTPLDIERRFGGAPAAPAPTPGLHHAGGFPHPGVPGSLAGGYNAAALVGEDLGLERWWPPPP